MKIVFIIWLGCLILAAYHVAILRNAGIYPPKKILRARAIKWGMACVLFFVIWIIMLLVG